MRVLSQRISTAVGSLLTRYFSELADDPPVPLLFSAIELAHRFKSTVQVQTKAFAPFDRVAFVTGRRDIEEVLLRGDVFSNREYLVRMRAASGAFFLGMDEERPGAPSRYAVEQRTSARALGKLEGKEHGFGRDSYSAEARRRLPPIIRRAAEAAVNARRPAGSLLVKDHLGSVVPARLLAEYFGIRPIDGSEDLAHLFQKTSDHIFNFFATSPKYREPAARAGRRVRTHLEQVVANARPGSDTVVGLLKAAFPGDDATVVRTVAGMASGAMVPTAGQFTHVVSRLLDLGTAHSASLRAACLADDEATILGFVREGARFYPYPPMIYRVCTGDHLLGAGTPHEAMIPAGALVVPVFIGASFDRDCVTNPWQFDPGRPREESMYFGFGAHECVGAYVGEVMLREMTRALFRLPGLKRNPRTRRSDQLEVSFTRAGSA